MKLKTFVSATFVALAAYASAQSGIAPYELDVKEFDQLKVVDGINVEYFCNPAMAGKVAFEAAPSVASAIIFEPNGKGKLEVKLAVRNAGYTNLPIVRVYSSYLTRVENDGDSTVRVMTVANGPRFDAKLVGNGRLEIHGINTARLNASLSTGRGTITIDGKTTDAKLSLTGTGQIEAFDLTSTNADCKVMGTGWIKCSVSDNLNVSGMGTGTVSYKGNPITRVKALNIKVKKFE